MSFLKLDENLVRNRMRLRFVEPDGAPAKTPWTEAYAGVKVQGVFDLDEQEKLKSEIEYNKRLSVPLEVTVDPFGGTTPYVVVVVPHPSLFEVAELSYPAFLIPGTGEVQPTLQLRGLKKFNLADLPWIATLHLMAVS